MRQKIQMRKYRKFSFAVWRLSRSILIAGLYGFALSACMSAAPKMLDQRTAVISGRATVGDNPNNAARKTLIRAAAMTLDHGFRYFQIMRSQNSESIYGGVSPIKPGVNVTIKLYREGEINSQRLGVWDAENIAAGNTGRNASLSAGGAATLPNRRSTTTAPIKSNITTPNCTVYGCTW
jgi:hypothetical protein